MNFYKKAFSLLSFLLFLCVFVSAQILPQPVRFSVSTKKLTDQTYEVKIHAELEGGWHLYSQSQPPEAVAHPTELTLSPNPFIENIKGLWQEVGDKKLYENVAAKIKQFQFSEEVDFVKVIKLKRKIKTELHGKLVYQVCNDEKCLPAGRFNFSIKL